MIYKYYSKNDFNTDAIRDKYFWFAKHQTLNDPFDMAGDFFDRFPTFLEEIRKNGYEDTFRKAIQKMAICCFSEEPDNKHLWALYANSYSGFVLGFDESCFRTESLEDHIGAKVIYHECFYVDSIPDFDNPDTYIPNLTDESMTPLRTLKRNLKGIDRVFTYYLLLKEKATWEIEKEKRMILGLNYIKQNPTPDKGYKINWLDNSLKEVIWGCRIAPEYKELIKELLPEDIIEKEILPRYSGLGYSLSIQNCTEL